MTIRLEAEKDYRIVENLTREAFWNQYVPGCDEHYLVHMMRAHEDFIPELDFVLTLDGEIIGSIMYTRSKLVDENGNEKQILTFGPVSILPKYQRQGYGKMLIEHSFMWVKDNEKIKFRRLTIAGTGGQCLMTPPDMKDGRIPIVLYNLGGSMINVIAGALFLGLFFATRSIPILSTLMLIFTAVGFMIAIMNGVPMRMGTVDNDGYNAFALTRNAEAMRSFWV